MLKINKLTTARFKVLSDGRVQEEKPFQKITIVALISALLFSIFAIFVFVKPRPIAVQANTILEPSIVVATDSTEFKQALSDWILLEKKKNLKLDKSFLETIANYSIHASLANNLEPTLMLALITVESRFDIFAKSQAGALGLTQIIPYWHQDKLKGLDVYDPKTNIDVGANILSQFKFQSNNNINNALKRYNGSLHLATDYDKKVLAKKKEIDGFLLASIKQSLKTQSSVIHLGE
jgi:Transglycosylase SLT domain